MIPIAMPAAALLRRSLAVNTPIIAGTGAIVAGVIASFRFINRESDEKASRRAFIRMLAADKTVSHELLLFYQHSDAPIREALRMIANPETIDDMRDALRKALAVSL